LLAITLKGVLVLSPSVVMEVMMPIANKAASMAYSIALAPESFLAKRVRKNSIDCLSDFRLKNVKTSPIPTPIENAIQIQDLVFYFQYGLFHGAFVKHCSVNALHGHATRAGKIAIKNINSTAQPRSAVK
jgi:hypothetical protein